MTSPPLPSLLNASIMYVCMRVCIYICIYMHVYICNYIHVGILYLRVFYICMSSIVYAVCQVFVSSYAYCVCPYYLCMCMYARIIVCSFDNVYFNVSSCNMQHKDIFLIYLNSYTCPHTPSMDVMWAHVYRRQNPCTGLRAFRIQMWDMTRLYVLRVSFTYPTAAAA